MHARTTVSALGTLTLLIGLPTPGAGLAVSAFLFAHALYKAPLFMVAGNIDHLMDLRRTMPWTAAVAILAGLPLSFGFVAKDVMAVIEPGAAALPADAVNALPPALVLTAIVIGFAPLCFSLVLAAWLASQQRHADVDRLRIAEPAATDAIKPTVLED